MEYAASDVTAIYRKIKDYAAMQSGRLYIFLDEIQELVGWE